MEKNIKDYLHLYLGCKVREVMSLGDDEYTLTKLSLAYHAIREGNKIFPILRPLSDMTEEEAKIYFGISESAEVYKKNMYDDHSEFLYRWEDRRRKYNTSDGMAHSAVGIAHNCENADMTPTQFLFLLSKHFDLFGLIEAGLAIDATTLKEAV
jgi:hypothetical protein